VQSDIHVGIAVDQENPATAVMVDLRGFTGEMSATTFDPPGRTRFLRLLGSLNGLIVSRSTLALHPALRDDPAEHVHLKSTGDGALIVFLHSEHHVRHATLATLLLRAAVAEMCTAYAESVGRPLWYGIGVESGTVARVRATGPLALSSTIGACINAAARVEEITKDIHRTEVIFCEHTVSALARQLLDEDYYSRMRATRIPAGNISDKDYLAAERDLVRLNRQLCLDYLHQHLLRGFATPTALFRLSKSSAALGNPRFDRLLERLTAGDDDWLEQVRSAL
jgi:class 3 adenylate cyclase